ncbi:hypothetical protein [Rhodopila sp.]|uniref:hypothetical protein n=1 Tax=Rhodopila sp. TaxID=2480087 RepID=UPI003D0CC124
MPELDLGLTLKLTASDELLRVLGVIADALARIAASTLPHSPSPVVPVPEQAVAQRATEHGGSPANMLAGSPAREGRCSHDVQRARCSHDVPGDLRPSSPKPQRPAEGPGRAAGPTSAGDRKVARYASPKGWLTAARKIELTRLWPTETPYQAIAAALRPLSDIPLPESKAIDQAAFRLGLRRPPSMRPASFPHYRTPPASAAASAILPTPAAPHDPPPIAKPPEPPPAPVSDPPPIATPPALDPVPRQAGTLPAAPIEASQEAIRQWGEARGIHHVAGFNLAIVNRKAHALGHPGFVVRRTARPAADVKPPPSSVA